MRQYDIIGQRLISPNQAKNWVAYDAHGVRNCVSHLKRFESRERWEPIHMRWEQIRKTLKRVIYYAVRIPLALVSYIVGIFVRREPELVALIPRKSSIYDGNIKYLHLHLSASESGKRAVILTSRSLFEQLSEQGLQAVVHPTIGSVKVLLRCGHIFYESTWWAKGFRGVLSNGATRWQLWHGNGIKAIAQNNPRVAAKMRRFGGIVPRVVLNKPERTDIALFASDSQRSARQTAFNAAFNVVIGQPRDSYITLRENDSLARRLGVDQVAQDRFVEARSEGLRPILFAPTWRRPELRAPWEAIDWAQLGGKLRELSAVLVIKAHFKDRKRLPSAKLLTHMTSDPHVIWVHPKSDILPFFVESDLLVTDYSSVFADFLLLGRPVIFFRYDHEEYAQQRALGGEIAMPGPVVASSDELLRELEVSLRSDPHAQERQLFARDFVHHSDGSACARILQLLREWDSSGSLRDDRDGGSVLQPAAS